MGYIYLKPPVVDQEDSGAEIELTKHMNPDQISIPYITDISIASYLDNMTVAAKSFKADYEKGYDTECGNNIDKKAMFLELN